MVKKSEIKRLRARQRDLEVLMKSAQASPCPSKLAIVKNLSMRLNQELEALELSALISKRVRQLDEAKTKVRTWSDVEDEFNDLIKRIEHERR